MLAFPGAGDKSSFSTFAALPLCFCTPSDNSPNCRLTLWTTLSRNTMSSMKLVCASSSCCSPCESDKTSLDKPNCLASLSMPSRLTRPGRALSVAMMASRRLRCSVSSGRPPIELVKPMPSPSPLIPLMLMPMPTPPSRPASAPSPMFSAPGESKLMAAVAAAGELPISVLEPLAELTVGWLWLAEATIAEEVAAPDVLKGDLPACWVRRWSAGEGTLRGAGDEKAPRCCCCWDGVAAALGACGGCRAGWFVGVDMIAIVCAVLQEG